MLAVRVLPKPHLWWAEPTLPTPSKEPGRRKRGQPVEEQSMRRQLRPALAFSPSKKWVTYAHLPTVNRGYFVDTYDLKAIGIRYGLSFDTRIYWRKFILPTPLVLLNADNAKAYYWSRIQLVVIDTMLRHHEKHGLLTLRKTHTSSLELIDHGCKVLTDYYQKRYENQAMRPVVDRFGRIMK